MDPTQYQQDYQVYQQAQNQAYYEEPRPHQYHFDAYQQHQYESYAQGVPRVEYEAGTSDLTLLPRFDGYVACRVWVDADVNIF